MATFTLTTNLLKNSSDDKRYVCDLLWAFTQSNSHKVAKDNKGRLLDRYKALILSERLHHILIWIDLMEKIPASFETIEIDHEPSDEELYLLISKNINGAKNIVVSSHQEWKKFKYSENTNSFFYAGSVLEVLDRDEALNEIMPEKGATYISSSIVATKNSQINDSELKQ